MLRVGIGDKKKPQATNDAKIAKFITINYKLGAQAKPSPPLFDSPRHYGKLLSAKSFSSRHRYTHFSTWPRVFTRRTESAQKVSAARANDRMRRRGGISNLYCFAEMTRAESKQLPDDEGLATAV